MTSKFNAALSTISPWGKQPLDSDDLHVALNRLLPIIADKYPEMLSEFLTDIAYLTLKIGYKGILSTLGEFDSYAPSEPDVQLLYRYLQQNAHLFADDLALTSLASLLYTRVFASQGFHARLSPNQFNQRPLLVPHFPVPDLPSANLKWTLKAHQRRANRCAVSGNGRFLVTCADDATAYIWDLNTIAEPIVLREPHRDHHTDINSCAIDYEGRLVATVDEVGTWKLWTLPEAKVRHYHNDSPLHLAILEACVLSSDGLWLIIGDSIGRLQIWETTQGRLLNELKGHVNVNHCALSRDKRFLLSVAYDRTARLWWLDDKAQLTHESVLHFSTQVEACSLSAAGNRAVISVSDGTLTLLAIGMEGQYERLHTFQAHNDVIEGCDISADGNLVVSGGRDTTLKLWNVSQPTEPSLLGTFRGHSERIRDCKFAADTKTVFSVSADMSLRQWEIEFSTRHNQMDQRPLLTDAIIGCALAPDGKQVALVNAQRQIYLYNSDDWSLIDSFTGHLDDILDCVFADDQTLISVSKDRTIQKWNLQNKEHILVGSHQHWISCCAVHPQKSTLLSAGWDRRIGLWDLFEPRLVQQYGGHEDAITRILWCTDGQLFASMSQDRTFKLWDVNNANPVATSPRQDSWLLCGQFMPHSMRLLTGAFDGKLRLWDFEYSTSTPIAEFRGHTDGVTDCALSPNQKWLATTSWDNTIRLWDVESQHCRVVLPVQSRLTRCLWVKDDLLLATSRNGCYLLDVLT